jgi:ribonuclease HI
MGCFILSINEVVEQSPRFENVHANVDTGTNELWKLYFDGANSKEGYGVGIVIVVPIGEKNMFSYKLEFEATNNVAKYEAFILGLEATQKYENHQNCSIWIF